MTMTAITTPGVYWHNSARIYKSVWEKKAAAGRQCEIALWNLIVQWDERAGRRLRITRRTAARSREKSIIYKEPREYNRSAGEIGEHKYNGEKIECPRASRLFCRALQDEKGGRDCGRRGVYARASRNGGRGEGVEKILFSPFLPLPLEGKITRMREDASAYLYFRPRKTRDSLRKYSP